MNRQAFFAALKSAGLFRSYSQAQVDLMEALLMRGAHLPAVQLAAVFGNVYHECKMKPVRENMNYSAKRIGQIFGPHRLQGHTPKQLARNPKALANVVYGGDWGRLNLGNVYDGDGWAFRGGGAIQVTGRTHFTRFGIDGSPDDSTQPDKAADIAVRGMERGVFRGHKLADFANGGAYDFKGARAIVNADVVRVGDDVARYSRAFLNALEEAGYKPLAAPVKPAPVSKPDTPSNPFAAFFAAIAALFKGIRK